VPLRPLLDEKEKATILFAGRVMRGAAGIRDSAPQELLKLYDQGQIVELTLAVCVANFTKRFNDALENILDLGV
jgi:alkylhydroperoxidase family enzyme